MSHHCHFDSIVSNEKSISNELHFYVITHVFAFRFSLLLTFVNMTMMCLDVDLDVDLSLWFVDMVCGGLELFV